MRRPRRRWIVLGVALLVLLLAPAAAWVSLTFQPRFYRAMDAVPRTERKAEAARFTAQTLSLSNDIRNQSTWKALFSDREVNAWLATDLVEHFADQLPPQVHEPRVAFSPDRVTLAFGFDRGPIRSVVTVVARVRVPEENVVALTLEKIHAGLVPIDPEPILQRVTEHAHRRGLDLRWERDSENLPVALIRYTTDPGRADIVLEQLRVQEGSISLVGRSNRTRGAVALPALPSRKSLQHNFPHAMRRVQGKDVSVSPGIPASRRKSSTPTS